jgi:dihydropyrimidinase
MALLICGGTVVTPWGQQVADVYVEEETIQAVGKELHGIVPKSTAVLDASDCLVLPGVIDAHVQLEGKYKETLMTDDFFSGTRAAACGGVTTIIDFAVQQQGGYSALEGLKARRAQADPKVCIDYSLHVGITDPTEETLREIDSIMKIGVTSFKCYMTYRNRGRLVEEPGLFRTMQEVASHNGIVEVHAENNNLVEYMTDTLIAQGKTSSRDFPASRTDLAEQVAVSTAVLLAHATDCDLFVHHVSSRRVQELIRLVQGQGMRVFAETCPQYLLLDDRVYQRKDGARFIINPPIRDEQSKKALWRGLAEGILQTVGTDHCSYTIAQKDEHKDQFQAVPAGVPGLETLLSLVYTYGVCTGRISLERMTEVLSLNPARIFGLYPRKGVIQPGSDADLVIYDPQGNSSIHARDLHMTTDFNAFEGMEVQGKVSSTLLRGRVIYQDGVFSGGAGMGRFVPGKRGT